MLKVKANEKLQKIGSFAGTYRYIMAPELYTTLNQEKVIKEAALRSGISKGVMQAAWDAAGEVIKAWATEGHSVAIPGLGSMRFGLRAKSVANVNEVKAGLIRSRRIIFTPTTDLKEELADTAIQITCYDRNGQEVKRVTSADEGIVEDNDNDNVNDNVNNGGNGNDNDNGNDNVNVNPNPNEGGGTNDNVNPNPNEGGGDNGGDDNGGGEPGEDED